MSAEAVDWSTPAEDVAVSINEALSSRPLITYCDRFQIELHSAEALVDSWPDVDPGTIVDHWDTGVFTVVAGDGRGVRVLSAFTRFHVNRTPYLWEVVLAAGIEAPVQLNSRPTAPAWVPYWERAARAWKTRATPTLAP